MNALLLPLAFAISFEVASIKPSPPQPMGQIRIGMGSDAGMLRYTNVSLKDCIRVAYRIKDFQVLGPDWLPDARFDITAKFPGGATEDQVPEMLQALLAERFKLTAHKESKEHNVYALVAGKNGPKLKPAEVPTGASRPPRGNMQIMVGPDGAHLKAPSATLANLAEMLSRFSERPVLDMTGIEGQYDFDLVFAPENLRNMPGPGGRMGGPHDSPSEPTAGSIYDSVHPYGLKLEPRKAAMEILVVDNILKVPTEN
jgi:uncharacterized protein (TIGR03435 family)